MRILKRNHDEAVSPVVGVMLMLVVTIIIAAVVSGFAGGLASGNTQTVPNLAMDVKITNTGSWIGSGFKTTVTGVSEAIPTSDLKLVTQWKTTYRLNSTVLRGGATTIGGVPNVDCWVGMKMNRRDVNSTAPFGSGSGVNGAVNPTCPFDKPAQQFGNYTFIPGTSMSALPYGSTSGTAIGGAGGLSDDGGYGVVNPFEYTDGTNYQSDQVDPTEAVLGELWENLKAGDTVSVTVIHAPSGKTIYQKDIVVTEA